MLVSMNFDRYTALPSGPHPMTLLAARVDLEAEQIPLTGLPSPARSHRQNSPAPSARTRRITACDSRESSKLNLQANSSPRSKNRQIRLLERARSFSPFNGF